MGTSNIVIVLTLGIVCLVTCDDAVIETDSLPSPTDIPSLSNGHVGFVVYGDSILMNGLYNGERGESHRARIPNYSNVLTSIECSNNCVYQLNMRKGYFQNTIRNESSYEIVQQIYAHRYFNRAIFNTFELRRVSHMGLISVNLKLSPGDEESVDLTVTNVTQFTISGKSINTMCYETKLIEDIRYQKTPSKVCVGYIVPPELLEIESSENSITYMHITVVAKNQNEVFDEFYNIFQAIDTNQNVLEMHSYVWEDHWNRFGISVEGNSNVNKVIHASLFYLISNLPSENSHQRNDPYFGLSPGGIPKGGKKLDEYQGHSFWDTEIWMYPPILLLNPKWSYDLLSYRLRTRQAAADNAKDTKYNGYRYPWESGFTGREVTPDCCPEVVMYQHHIIADIAFAFRMHLAATRDENWWKSYGCDLAYETARFWASRVKYNESTQHYDIRNVMGPDEDHHDIDNNVYTNVIAAINLYFGDFAGCSCKSVLNISNADYERFVGIARGLTLLYDERYNRHPQYEGYDGSDIKQADTVLLGYPLQFPMQNSTKLNNLIYYDTRTRENGPAMTWSMHTIGFLDLEDEESATIKFEKSYSVYIREPFYVWSEAIKGTDGVGNFITGAGGFLQSVINGYGGIRLNFDDMIIRKGFLPSGTKKLKFNGIVYLGYVFSLEITKESKTILVLKTANETEIDVIVDEGVRGSLLSFLGSPLVVDRLSEIKFKPKSKFGVSENCEMRETIVGQKVEIEAVPFTDDEWILGSNYLPDLYKVPTLSNGHVGFVIFGDLLFMNGLYNGRNGQSHRAKIPNFSNIDLSLNCAEKNCAYHLHLKHGFFEKIVYSGRSFKLTQELYAHRYYNRLIVNRFVMNRLEGFVEESVAMTLNGGVEESDDLRQLFKDELVVGTSGKIILRCYETLIVEDPIYQKNMSTVCVAHTSIPSHLTLQRNQNKAEYIHLTSVGKTIAEVLTELTDVLREFNYEKLFSKHKAVWEDYMNKYEMSVDGNKHLNQVIHSSLFYLISSLPSEDSNQPNGMFYGLSPSGLPKGSYDNEYNGHSFWDTEIWMHPPILLLNPNWSKQLLNYRYFVRQAAEDYAKQSNYTGYRYPWESAFTGRETCPEWAWEVIEFQHHITADIAFAFRSHLAATHDINWFKQYGCDIAHNTAKFWSSRAKFNQSTGYYDIKGIMGPDEDHWDVDNNVYTNVIAAMNLYLGDFADCLCKSFKDSIDFAKIARSLKLIYDQEKDYHPQFEGYNISRTKQADVILVNYPLQLPMSDSTKRNNLLIYENVTRATGPAMTWSMHTIGFLDIKDEENAAKMFEKSYRVYTHEPFKTWSENQPEAVEGSGNFITGAGGFLQSVMNGYAGIKLHFDHLSITNFYNPPESQGLSLKGINYLNSTFNLRIVKDSATLNFIKVSENLSILLVNATSSIEVTDTTIVFSRNQKLILKSTFNGFGACAMKETILGEKSAASILKMSHVTITVLMSILRGRSIMTLPFY